MADDNSCVFSIEDYQRAKEIVAHAKANACVCVNHLPSIFACENCMAVLIASTLCEAAGRREASLAAFDSKMPKA